jgi:hypothetical protein
VKRKKSIKIEKINAQIVGVVPFPSGMLRRRNNATAESNERGDRDRKVTRRYTRNGPSRRFLGDKRIKCENKKR